MPINIKLFHQPKSFWALIFGELWCTFSYFGTQTILVLYFIHIFHLSRNDSYLLYGGYVAFAYSLPILGGFVADKWLGGKTTVLVGSSLNIVGNLLLMSFNYYLFCLGLATALVGSGLYKNNVTHLIGELYQERSLQKETGFTLLYLAINVGGVLGPLIYSLVIYAVGWDFGFLCSTVGILISAMWFFKYRHLFDQNPKPAFSKKPKNILLCTTILGPCLLISWAFYMPKAMNLLVISLFLVGLLYLMMAIRNYQNKDRRRLIALFLLSFLGMFYFAAGLQIGTTITLFIQHNINQGIIKTPLPASIFTVLYPLFVLLLAPFFSYLWGYLASQKIFISTPARLTIGMVLAALGIGLFALSSFTHYIIAGILVGNLLLSAGELAFMPAVYTTISDLSPAGIKSTMMGCWLLFIGLGGYLSSLLASASHTVAAILPFHQYAYCGEFVFIAGFTFIIALALTAFTPKLSSMLR